MDQSQISQLLVFGYQYQYIYISNYDSFQVSIHIRYINIIIFKLSMELQFILFKIRLRTRNLARLQSELSELA